MYPNIFSFWSILFQVRQWATSIYLEKLYLLLYLTHCWPGSLLMTTNLALKKHNMPCQHMKNSGMPLSIYSYSDTTMVHWCMNVHTGFLSLGLLTMTRYFLSWLFWHPNATTPLRNVRIHPSFQYSTFSNIDRICAVRTTLYQYSETTNGSNYPISVKANTNMSTYLACTHGHLIT